MPASLHQARFVTSRTRVPLSRDRFASAAEPDVRACLGNARCGHRAPASGRTAFTLLEVLLTLALIGLLAAVLVGGGAQLLNNKPVAPDDVFWSAVQEARKMALKTEQEATLRYVDDKDAGKSFVVTRGDTTKLFPMQGTGDLDVSFLAQQKGGNVAVIAGTVVETQKLNYVTFYADGTCSAFRVQFFRNGAVHTMEVDPWTCAPVLSTSDANASNPPQS